MALKIQAKFQNQSILTYSFSMKVIGQILGDSQYIV